MSALKKDGVRLYDLARQGIQVDREARPVTIYKLVILSYDSQKGELELDCACSQGTYIRTLCDDLGRLLGCGAVMTALRRTEAAGYSLKDCVTMEELRELAAKGQLAQRLLTVESAFYAYPAIRVSGPQAARFGSGGGLSLGTAAGPGQRRHPGAGPGGALCGVGHSQGGPAHRSAEFLEWA